jgi:phenylpyruvate tautomerase PptA (4-oxalocrotonate tautomerase family)
MPYLLIRTNREVTPAERPALLKKCSAHVAEALGKPERFVMVSLEPQANMLFAGEEAPCAYLEMKSIGLPGDRTAGLSAGLCQLIADELDIPVSRIYIEFADAARHMWGWDGKTF